ncbi:histone-lysine N-methyltransferase SETMAR [Trichonephila clavipes]|nr:histone-lysine N-methyltransferase SETMAR [Trichonephila clavipes]
MGLISEMYVFLRVPASAPQSRQRYISRWKTQGFAYRRSVYFCVGFLDVGTINVTRYGDTLLKLKESIRKKRSGFLISDILLLDENARSHSATETRNHIATIEWKRLHYPPYSPDLASSDFHLFLALKKNLA